MDLVNAALLNPFSSQFIVLSKSKSSTGSRRESFTLTITFQVAIALEKRPSSVSSFMFFVSPS